MTKAELMQKIREIVKPSDFMDLMFQSGSDDGYEVRLRTQCNGIVYVLPSHKPENTLVEVEALVESHLEFVAESVFAECERRGIQPPAPKWAHEALRRRNERGAR